MLEGVFTEGTCELDKVFVDDEDGFGVDPISVVG